jgi:hypothetical protein
VLKTGSNIIWIAQLKHKPGATLGLLDRFKDAGPPNCTITWLPMPISIAIRILKVNMA